MNVLWAFGTILIVFIHFTEQVEVNFAPSKVNPPSIPTNVNVYIRPGAVDLTWSKPAFTYGSLAGYYVDWSLQQNNKWSPRKFQFVSNGTYYYSVLKNSYTSGWDIYLSAFNRYPNGTVVHGQAVRSYVTQLPVPPGPFKAVNATIKSKSIDLKWIAPQGRVDGYLVQYSIREKKTWPIPSLNYLGNTNNQFSIKKTDKTTGYEIYLTPYNQLTPQALSYGPTWRLYNGAAATLPSILITGLLSLLIYIVN